MPYPSGDQPVIYLSTTSYYIINVSNKAAYFNYYILRELIDN